MNESKLNKETYAVNLQPVGRRADINAGKSLLEAAQDAGVELVSLCGGVGACDSCQVRLVSGKLSEHTLEEQAMFTQAELENGYRLACQAYPLSDVKLDIPPESLTTPQRLQVEGQEFQVEVDPSVAVYDLRIDPPSIHDLRADTSRLRAALRQAGAEDEVAIGMGVLQDLSPRLREYDWECNAVVRGGDLVAVIPKSSSPLGLAFDVGTTKLAGFLVDLNSGATLAMTGAMNPQIAYGEDVISRIAYTLNKAEGGATLQRRLVTSLNEMIELMTAEAGVSPGQIVEVVIVGNTAMHHILTHLPVHQLGTAPYVPAVSEPLELRARELGLEIAPDAFVYLPSNIAGYVGGDHVAMLMATGLWQQKRTVLALDIGTNTEISVVRDGRLVSCSCASGPAFEGAVIRDGMRAAPGAIERVQIQDGQVRTATIGDMPPVGICGSGILDAVAEMLSAGIIDVRGALDRDHALVREMEVNLAFVLAEAAQSGHGREVLVTRNDVYQIQLAKSAIRAGINILLKETGIAPEQLDDFIIAGAFGTYISVENAVRIGMFPKLPRERFHQVGNAAGAGARQILLSNRTRRQALEIIPRIDYIELAAHPDFINEFSNGMFFEGKVMENKVIWEAD